jgi:cytosine deaminase
VSDAPSCTDGSAAMMGLADYGLQVGKSVDLMLLKGSCLAEAVVSRPRGRITFKRGRITACAGAATFSVA